MARKLRRPRAECVGDDSGARSDPSWFGFALPVRPTAPFTRTELARHLDANRIHSRMLFGGNLLRQPVFVELRRERPAALRVVGDTPGADRLLHEVIFVGVFPGLTSAMIDWILETIHDFCRAACGNSASPKP